MFSRLTFAVKRYLFVAVLALMSLAPALSFPAPAAAADPFPIDFSQVTVNSQKQAEFRTNLYSIYYGLKQDISVLGKSRIKSVRIVYPEVISKLGGSKGILGLYDPETAVLYVNSSEFGQFERVQSTFAHEVLHSFVVNGTGYDYRGGGVRGDVFEEMIVEHYAVLYFGTSERLSYDDSIHNSGYYHLVKLVPEITAILAAAGGADPDDLLQRALFKGSLSVIDKQVDPFLDEPGFLQHLSSYLSVDESKSNIAGAHAYLSAVLAKVKLNTGASTVAGATTPIALTVKTATQEEATNYIIPSGSGGLSYPLYVTMVSTPAADVKVTVITRGALPISTGVNELTFTKDNFNSPQRLVVSYGANGTNGQKAEVLLKGAGIVTTIIGISLGATPTTPAGAVVVSGSSGGTTAGGTGSATASGVGPFLGKFLLPDCLRTGEKAVNAEFDTCVLDSVRHYIELLLLVTALASFGYLLYGAFLYASTFGDEAKATLAKKVITAALIGAALSTLAYFAVVLLAQGLGLEGGLLRAP